MEIAADPGRVEPVPPSALLLSLLSLWVPVLSSWLFPDWTNDDVGILVWLLALVPPFLLSYHRGWRGVSLALAGAMAAFSLGQVAVLVLGAAPPRVEALAAGIAILVGVSLGSGWLSDRFRRSLDRAEHLALTDAGTALPNRRHAMLHLGRAFAAAQRDGRLAVVVYDLDHFKRINDRFGHQVGDDVLRVFAAILSRHTREMNLSARFGGEEFITVLDGGTGGGAAQMAERVRQDLKEASAGQVWGPVTASAGVAEYEDGMASPEVLIAAADQALYRAKDQGRDRVVRLGRQGRSADDTVRVPPAAHADAAAHGAGETVLVVDDDPGVLRVVMRALKRRGFTPFGSTDPLEALSIARGLPDPVDLVVVDVVMPTMSGFRLVEILGQVQPTVRALYISGYRRDEVNWAGVPGDVKAFLPKPIPIDELVRHVRATLDAPLTSPATPAGHEPARPPAPPQLSTVVAAQSAQLEDAYSEMLLRLAWATEFRDDTTGRHAERVGRLAGLLALEMGLDPDLADLIERAAPVHDVGKIAVPDAVLRKPGPLTPLEREIIHDHCRVGSDLLSGSRHPLIQEAERIARCHHERWDGGGYPEGLAGDEIPLSARITAVADVFDSLTSVRPYRSSLPPAEALEAILRERGGQFDPAVVDALMRLADAGRLIEAEEEGLVGARVAAGA